MITKVTDYLYRGPRPENMIELKALGINQIINLEVGYFEWFHGEAGEEEDMAEEALIEIEHIPLSDIRAPAKSELDYILAKVQSCKEAGEKVYLHCLHGADRTGISCAYFLVKVEGWSVDAAIENMYAMGFHKIYAFLGWVRALRSYLK